MTSGVFGETEAGLRIIVNIDGQTAWDSEVTATGMRLLGTNSEASTEYPRACSGHGPMDLGQHPSG
jgi:hypothetical protein